MLPIASASGLAAIGVAVSGSLLFLWYLLRAENREQAEKKARKEE